MRDSRLLTCAAFALAAAAVTAAPESRNVGAGTELNAALVTSLDSSRVKPGDEVTARITQNVKSADGAVVIPKGATLVGRVTQARQHGSGGSGTGGASAELGMIFDRAVTSDGKAMIGRSPGAVGGVASNGRLISGSRGVFAIADLEIAPASAGSKATVLMSARKTVELDPGTQLLLVISDESSKQTES